MLLAAEIGMVASPSSTSVARTLVRVSDGASALGQAVADEVEDDLALGREALHALSPAHSRAGDQAVQAGEVELAGLELELGGGRLEMASADDELGDQPGARPRGRRERGGT